MHRLRTLFTPALGSRARNIARAVLPALQLCGVINLSPDQVAALVIAIEVVFSGGGEIARRF